MMRVAKTGTPTAMPANQTKHPSLKTGTPHTPEHPRFGTISRRELLKGFFGTPLVLPGLVNTIQAQPPAAKPQQNDMYKTLRGFAGKGGGPGTHSVIRSEARRLYKKTLKDSDPLYIEAVNPRGKPCTYELVPEGGVRLANALQELYKGFLFAKQVPKPKTMVINDLGIKIGPKVVDAVTIQAEWIPGDPNTKPDGKGRSDAGRLLLKVPDIFGRYVATFSFVTDKKHPKPYVSTIKQQSVPGNMELFYALEKTLGINIRAIQRDAVINVIEARKKPN